ncbi:MAG: DUF86 domain-containing protein [Acidobacteriota bacterium]
MVDLDVVTAKISTLERCLARIESTRSQLGLAEADRDDITALNLERAIQAVMDLAIHVVATEGYGVPDSAGDSFRLLGERRIIPGDLVERLRKMVGFRNISIHDYRKLDPAIFQSIIAGRLGDLREFAARLIDAFGLASS